MACIRMSLRSRVLDVDTVVNVVIPYDHFDREGRPKPFTRTLYLLHGLRQNADAWQRMSSAERFANYYGYALIMPDAQRSFYTDMAHGPRFFTYLTEELPEIMQAMFKIPADPEHTSVGGLSMGGYGALKCALRAGDVFSRGASLSGAADIRQLPPGGYWEDVFGPREQIPGSFNDLFAAAKALPPENRPPLYMWCGTEDSLLPGNHALRDHLLALGYDLTYAESAGNHAWQWWDLHIQDVLRWLFPQTEVK